MKITITKEFSSAEDAAAFINFIAEAPVKNPSTEGVSSVVQTPAAEAPTRARKPRNDAGKPRGPYKKSGADAPTTEAKPGEPIAPADKDTAGQQTPPVSASATSAAEPQAGAPGEASVPELTVEALRETLGKLQKIPGKGVEACLAAIAKFGVQRISDLPKEKYTEFDAYVKSLLTASA